VDTISIGYVAAFLIGAAVGLGELVSRYRDEPVRAVVTWPAGLYIAINGAASVFALYALIALGAQPGEHDAQGSFLVVLAAGFGAMAVFRSALFTIRVGDTDIGVGPVAFLDIILGATDRGVDRLRAEERAPKVVWVMEGLVFSEVAASLPSFAMGLLQNLPAERQAAIAEQVKKLRDSDDLQEKAKVLNLGLLLMNEVGEDVLEKASRGLRQQFGWPALGPEPGPRRWRGILRRTPDEAPTIPPAPGVAAFMPEAPTTADARSGVPAHVTAEALAIPVAADPPAAADPPRPVGAEVPAPAPPDDEPTPGTGDGPSGSGRRRRAATRTPGGGEPPC
jgi:hypothetical protein